MAATEAAATAAVVVAVAQLGAAYGLVTADGVAPALGMADQQVQQQHQHGSLRNSSPSTFRRCRCGIAATGLAVCLSLIAHRRVFTVCICCCSTEAQGHGNESACLVCPDSGLEEERIRHTTPCSPLRRWSMIVSGPAHHYFVTRLH